MPLEDESQNKWRKPLLACAPDSLPNANWFS
jgi:hypothetical protein